MAQDRVWLTSAGWVILSAWLFSAFSEVCSLWWTLMCDSKVLTFVPTPIGLSTYLFPDLPLPRPPCSRSSSLPGPWPSTYESLYTLTSCRFTPHKVGEWLLYPLEFPLSIVFQVHLRGLQCSSGPCLPAHTYWADPPMTQAWEFSPSISQSQGTPTPTPQELGGRHQSNSGRWHGDLGHLLGQLTWDLWSSLRLILNVLLPFILNCCWAHWNLWWVE